MARKKKSNSQNKKKPSVISSQSSSEDSDTASPKFKTHLSTSPVSSRAAENDAAQTIPREVSSGERKMGKNCGASGSKATDSVDIFAQFRGMKLTERTKSEIQIAHSKNSAKANKRLLRIRKNLQRQKDEQLASNTNVTEMSKNNADQKGDECSKRFSKKKSTPIKSGNNEDSSLSLKNQTDIPYTRPGRKFFVPTHLFNIASSFIQKEKSDQFKLKFESADSQDENSDPQDENVDHKDENADPQDEKASQEESADPQSKITHSQDESADFQDESADFQDESTDSQDESTDSQDESADFQDESADDSQDETVYSQDESAESQYESADTQNENTGSQNENTGPQDERAGTQSENAETEDENADSQDENCGVLLREIFEQFKKQFYEMFEDRLKKQINQDASAQKLSTDIFANGLPIVEDVESYKELWEELKTPFSFHESVWHEIYSARATISDISETSEHTETLNGEGDEICSSSSPISELKSESSISNKPNFSEGSLSSSESSSGNSVITVVPANFRAPGSEIKETSKRENIFETSESKVQTVQNQINCASGTTVGNISTSEALTEFRKLDSSPESTDFSRNNKAPGKTFQHQSTSSSSNISYVTASDLDEDDFYNNQKCEEELENVNRSRASSECTSCSWISDYKIKTDVQRIYENADMSDQAKIKECYRLLYHLDIEMQNAFDGLFKTTDKILTFIFTSHPEAYRNELRIYSSGMTVLRYFNRRLKLLNWKFCKVVEVPPSIYRYNCEDVKTQLILLAKKMSLIFQFWCLLNKYNERFTDLLATTSRALTT